MVCHFKGISHSSSFAHPPPLPTHTLTYTKIIATGADHFKVNESLSPGWLLPVQMTDASANYFRAHEVFTPGWLLPVHMSATSANYFRDHEVFTPGWLLPPHAGGGTLNLHG